MQENFPYNKETTRTVCRGCGNKYSDWYYSDVDGSCDDCNVTSGHCGFTNQGKKKYQLISTKTKNPIITIDESAKEDFMELMEWDEDEFDANTVIIEADE